MKRYAVAAFVVISVLLCSAVLVVPATAKPTAQASGGFQSGPGGVIPRLRLELAGVRHLLARCSQKTDSMISLSL